MFHVFLTIAPLFLIIFASALLQNRFRLGENWVHVLNAYALNIGFPALIFTALAGATFSFAEELLLIVGNSLFIVSTLLLAIVIGKAAGWSQKMRATMILCLAFGNVAFLGIPVLVRLSGEVVLPEASVIVAVYLFWIFTIGIAYAAYVNSRSKKNVIKHVAGECAKNPLVIAVLAGALFGSTGLTMPTMIMSALEMVSQSVTPIVLVIVGLFIGSMKLGKLDAWMPVLTFSAVTLFVLPLIFFAGVLLTGQSLSFFSHSIIEAAMPLAITPFALAARYNLDQEFIARAIVASTILSVISLPLWISFVA